MEAWRVDISGMVPVERDDWGHFYSQDCYVILYTYTPKKNTEYIIYTWQGLDTTKEQVGPSLLSASPICSQLSENNKS